MLGWALTFLVVALIAAVLGLGGIARFTVEIAKIIFFVAIILFRHLRDLWVHARPFTNHSLTQVVSHLCLRKELLAWRDPTNRQHHLLTATRKAALRRGSN